jgi:hypothetical protein
LKSLLVYHWAVRRYFSDSLLDGIRNGMAHALSVPKGVFLTNTLLEAREIAKSRRGYIISTTDFVAVVDATINKMCAENPNSVFDPLSVVKGRGPATGWTEPTI